AQSRRASAVSLPNYDNAALGATVLSAGRSAAEAIAGFDRRAMTALARRAAMSLGLKKPGWMAEVPRPIRFGVGGAMAIVVIVVVAIAFRSPAAEDVLLAADSSSPIMGGAPGKPGSTARPASTARGDDTGFKMPDLLGGDDERASIDARRLMDRFERELQSRQL